jgi:hypothetical protein
MDHNKKAKHAQYVTELDSKNVGWLSAVTKIVRRSLLVAICAKAGDSNILASDLVNDVTAQVVYPVS